MHVFLRNSEILFFGDLLSFELQSLVGCEALLLGWPIGIGLLFLF